MKEFKAESKRLLELMIHSIYTHKEIFLRELISNASDATDKRYYQQVQQGGEALNREELPITIGVDKETRTLTIADHGIGMTEAELESNLGTIAQSGSLEFKEEMTPVDGESESDQAVDIIGQFGVGFYSAFMVADQVVVETLTQDGTPQRWESHGIEGYTITKGSRTEVGTQITLTIKENTEEESYDEFLNSYQLQRLIVKHSDYIRYPIQMELEKSRKVEGSEEDYESYSELTIINSRTPLWKKKKSEVTTEEYYQFYKDKFYDYQDPMKVITTSTEGAATYHGLLFIPSHQPMNYHSKEYKKGLQLYASGVLIMEHCADLLPDYYGFVRGVVDSQDLSLNISREMLQHDRQLSVIGKHIERKIHSELELLLKNNREAYNKFFENFGLSLKYGLYESYGAAKEELEDLLLFESSLGELVTLREYRDRMPEGQEFVYYASGESLTQLKNLPAAEAVRERGYEILYFTDQVDEFAIRMLGAYDEKEFQSIAAGDLGLATEEEKVAMDQQAEDHADLLTQMKGILEGKVAAVTLSARLKTHPVWLATQGDLTLEMEKTLARMPGNPDLKAERVLELNPNHPIFGTLTKLAEAKDEEKLKTYTQILYQQSLLLEGLPLEDPVAFTDAVSGLMI